MITLSIVIPYMIFSFKANVNNWKECIIFNMCIFYLLWYVAEVCISFNIKTMYTVFSYTVTKLQWYFNIVYLSGVPVKHPCFKCLFYVIWFPTTYCIKQPHCNFYSCYSMNFYFIQLNGSHLKFVYWFLLLLILLISNYLHLPGPDILCLL